ncbi:MAG: hypothetical protein D6732_02795 [Methanobacteriota archaeon]|nr:MAG: hypothetical protein D6732_02795 [Euryarchaeota archaeon]
MIADSMVVVFGAGVVSVHLFMVLYGCWGLVDSLVGFRMRESSGVDFIGGRCWIWGSTCFPLGKYV